MSTEITITSTTIDINVSEYPITIEAPSGAYPLPTSVYSVFGRTGNVVATEGDYTLTQLAGVTITSPSAGQALVYNGTSWVNNTETYVGTVTSVSATVPTGLTITGSPITTSGTLAFGLQTGYSIPTTANQATWDTAYNDSIVSAAVTGTTTKTLTLNQQDGGTITASWTDDNTDAVTSVFGRTGAVVATEGDYSLTQLSDVTLTSPTSGQSLTYNGTNWVNSNAAASDNLIQLVRNNSGATMTAGTVVYINGALGNKATIAKALATSDATSAQTYGLVQNDIANNADGYVVVIGDVNNLNTSSFTEGQQLYLSGTTAGTYTATKPYAPIHLVYIGIVLRSHPTQGIIGVKIQNGYEMDELHNVAAQSPNNGDILQYVSSTNLWTKTAGSTTNISEGTNLYFTDTRARASITLTTTGTSGAATYTSGVINIPQYQSALTNPVTGTGTTNTLPKFTGASAIGDSNIDDTGSLITLGSDTTISSGGLGIGTTTLTAYNLRITSPLTGGTAAFGVNVTGQIQSDVTSTARIFGTQPSTIASAFTLASLQHFTAGTTTIGAGSAITNQYGFLVLATAIGATNNYAFSGQLAAATNTWNLYMSGTAANYMAGSLGIGQTSLTNRGLSVSKNITGGTTSYGITSDGTIQSDVTSSSVYYLSSPNTAAASFTLSNLYHYLASQSTIGAGSIVTNQYGYNVSANLIGATNNYGFFGNIASGTGRWNLFMNGTADNYLSGNLGIGGSQNNVTAGSILTSTLTNGGAGYVDGIYTDVAVTAISTNGTYALYTITVVSGIVTDATLTWGGQTYKVGDTITVSNTLLGGTGSGLIITVATVDSSILKLSSGTTTGSDLSLYRSSTSILVTNPIGSIKWEGNDASTKSSGVYAKLSAFAAGSSGGAYLSFFTSVGAGGALTEQLRIGNGGQVGIGGAYSLTGYSLRVSKNITGAVNSFGIASDGEIQSGVTTSANLFYTSAATAATTFTLTSLNHFAAVQGTFGAGSTVTNQYGFIAGSSLIGATTNYGFYGAIPSGTNRWNLYMNGTANNYMAGSLGIGSTSLTGYNLRVNKNPTGATVTYGISMEGTIQSDVTSAFVGYRTLMATVNSAFTLGILTHFDAYQGTIGAGSTLTTQYGFVAESNMIGATNNYGFYGNIPSGTGRWNIYMNGTAQNYLAGNTGIGAAATTTSILTLGAGTTAQAQINLTASTAPTSPANGDIWFDGTNLKIRVGGVTKTVTIV